MIQILTKVFEGNSCLHLQGRLLGPAITKLYRNSESPKLLISEFLRCEILEVINKCFGET